MAVWSTVSHIKRLKTTFFSHFASLCKSNIQSHKSANTTAGFTEQTKLQIQNPETIWDHMKLPSQTYRQKYVAVALIKVSIGFLRDLYQFHFLLHRKMLKDVSDALYAFITTWKSFSPYNATSAKSHYLNSPDYNPRVVSYCSECVLHVGILLLQEK